MGAYPPGSRLPAEPILARQLGIARPTLREALRHLERNGQLQRRRGIGTFVSRRAPTPVLPTGLERLESMESIARRQGFAVTTRDVAIRTERASARIAERLALAERAPVTVLARSKWIGEARVAYMVTAVPATICPADELRAGFRDSFIDYLVARGLPAIGYAHAELSPRLAGRVIGRQLDVAPKTVLMLLEERFRGEDGSYLAYTANYFLPGYFKFEVIRQVTP